LLESKGYNEDRRAFFSAMKDEIKNIAGRAAVYAAQEQLEKEKTTSPERVKVMPDGTLPHFLPDRRRHLLRCLLSLGEPVDTLIETRLWGHMIIDVELCSSCQMCVTFCPTGAISKYVEKDGPSGVVFRPRDCVKCRCCADICPEHAITISEEVFAVDLLSGAEESYAMTPAKNPPGNPRAIVNAMKALLKSDQVYER
jgi:ferredoxin